VNGITGDRENANHDGSLHMMVKRIVVVALILSVSAAFPGEVRAGVAEQKQRTVEKYTVPDVVLVNQDGAKISLKKYLETDKPVMVDFIYGTCTTICPVLSAAFVSLQRRLGTNSRDVRLVSISIDPENDSPKVMKEYLKRYRAMPGWDFLTGSRADIDRVMYAFSAYVANKMDHYPLTLIRHPSDGRWVRVDGLMSSSELLEEYKRVVKK
jgi:protein SCO1/2